jgi:hypothetical protein
VPHCLSADVQDGHPAAVLWQLGVGGLKATATAAATCWACALVLHHPPLLLLLPPDALTAAAQVTLRETKTVARAAVLPCLRRADLHNAPAAGLTLQAAPGRLLGAGAQKAKVAPGAPGDQTY